MTTSEGYVRRDFRDAFLGRGFNSHRLHHLSVSKKKGTRAISCPFPASGVWRREPRSGADGRIPADRRAGLEAVEERHRVAAREDERADAQPPAERRGRVLLVHVPEGAVVDRVDVHRGVVAPALARRSASRCRSRSSLRPAASCPARRWPGGRCTRRWGRSSSRWRRCSPAPCCRRCPWRSSPSSGECRRRCRGRRCPPGRSPARCSGLRISHQRMPAMLAEASTDWFVTSDSCVPKLR